MCCIFLVGAFNMTKELGEGYRDITIPGWGDDRQMVKLAHEILDRVEMNLHFMVESIKAKKKGEVGLYPEG